MPICPCANLPPPPSGCSYTPLQASVESKIIVGQAASRCSASASHNSMGDRPIRETSAMGVRITRAIGELRSASAANPGGFGATFGKSLSEIVSTYHVPPLLPRNRTPSECCAACVVF